MSRITTIIVSALTIAALAPAAASAADVELRGAPTLRLVNGNQAQLQFTTDEKLPRKADGSLAASVIFSNQGASSVATWGRHGNDFVYAAGIRSQRKLHVGTKYTVRIIVPGQAPIIRKVKLHDKRR